jgi:hypothetical protein
MRRIALIFLFFLGWAETNAQSTTEGQRIKFMGRDVTIVKPELTADGFPKGPASVCLEAPPQRQCYTAPRDFRGNPVFVIGKNPTVEVVRLDKGTPALFFSAESGGVSGWAIHFALLRPGQGKELENLLEYGLSVSNQNQHAFWNETTISNSPIFITAEDVWGPGESHYEVHRYVISAYSLDPEGGRYWLADRYMTVRRYDLENADILASEKQEILARLRRVKAEMERENKAR